MSSGAIACEPISWFSDSRSQSVPAYKLYCMIWSAMSRSNRVLSVGPDSVGSRETVGGPHIMVPSSSDPRFATRTKRCSSPSGCPSSPSGCSIPGRRSHQLIPSESVTGPGSTGRVVDIASLVPAFVETPAPWSLTSRHAPSPDRPHRWAHRGGPEGHQLPSGEVRPPRWRSSLPALRALAVDSGSRFCLIHDVPTGPALTVCEGPVGQGNLLT